MPRKDFSHDGQTAGTNFYRSTPHVSNVHTLIYPQTTSQYNQITIAQCETNKGLGKLLTGQSLDKTSLIDGRPFVQKCLNPKNKHNNQHNKQR